MEDPILNRSLEESKELSQRWNQFKDFCTMAIQKGQVSGQAEMKFMELKSRIAMLHDGFMETLERDQKIGQNMMQMLQECILLRRVADYNESEKQKFEFDWNECYMLLTEHISFLEEEKERLGKISESAHAAMQRKERMQNSIKNFFTGPGFKLMAGIAVLVLVFYVVPNFIWSYRGLYSTPAKPLYLMVSNIIWRPISPDYEYDSLQDIPAHKEWGLRPPFQEQDNSSLDKNFLMNNFLASMGFTTDDLKKKLNTALDSNSGLTTFESQLVSVSAENATFFFLFFKDSQAAKNFVQLLIDARRTLPNDVQNQLRNEVTVYRSANFVSLSRATHPLGNNMPKEKYKVFKAEEKNLYDVVK